MTAKSALKKCPFCGNSMTVIVSIIPKDKLSPFAVVCQICGAQGPVSKTKAKAKKDWNTRG